MDRWTEKLKYLCNPLALGVIFFLVGGVWLFGGFDHKPKLEVQEPKQVDCARPWIARVYIGSSSGRFNCQLATVDGGVDCTEDWNGKHSDLVHWSSAVVEISHNTKCPK